MAAKKNKWARVHRMGKVEQREPSLLSRFGATVALMFMGAILGAVVFGFYPYYRAYFEFGESGYRRSVNRQYAKEVESESIDDLYARLMFGGASGLFLGGAIGFYINFSRRKRDRGTKIHSDSVED